MSNRTDALQMVVGAAVFVALNVYLWRGMPLHVMVAGLGFNTAIVGVVVWYHIRSPRPLQWVRRRILRVVK